MDAREALIRAADSECDGSSSCPVDRHIHGCFAEEARHVILTGLTGEDK